MNVGAAILVVVALSLFSLILTRLIKGIAKMAVTLQQLDAAIAAETTENATLLSAVTQLDTDVQALIAQVQAGQDFTNELNAVNANLATITGVVSSAQAEDQSVQSQLTPPPAAKPA